MTLLGIDWVGINPENGRKLLLSIAFVVVVLAVSAALRWVVGLALGRTDHASQQTKFWTRQAVSLLAAIVLILGLLSIWFNDPTRLATAFGLMSAGLAFALQQVITSIAGYFVILRGSDLQRSATGSTMGGVRGDVMRLGFIQTTIMEMGQPPSVQGADPAMWVKSRQFTGRIVTVSNSKIFAEPVFNYTREFPFIWEEMPIPITYTRRTTPGPSRSCWTPAGSIRSTPTPMAADAKPNLNGARFGVEPIELDPQGLLPNDRQLAGTDGALHRPHPPDPQREGRHGSADHSASSGRPGSASPRRPTTSWGFRRSSCGRNRARQRLNLRRSKHDAARADQNSSARFRDCPKGDRLTDSQGRPGSNGTSFRRAPSH